MAGEELGFVEAADAEDLRKEIEQQLQLLRDDAAFREDAQEAGIDLDLLDQIPRDSALFDIEKPSNRLGGVGEAILIKIAVNVGTAATIALSTMIWQRIIAPAIDKGGRSIRPPANKEGRGLEDKAMPKGE